MSKRLKAGVRIGASTAREILAILKRHGNLRFNNSDAKDFALAEVAELMATDDDNPEARTPTPPSAHTGQVRGAPSLTGSGDDDDAAAADAAEAAAANGAPD